MAVAPEELYELKRIIEKRLGIVLEPWQLAFLENLLFNPKVEHGDQVIPVWLHDGTQESIYTAMTSAPSQLHRRVTLTWEVEEPKEETE